MRQIWESNGSNKDACVEDGECGVFDRRKTLTVYDLKDLQGLPFIDDISHDEAILLEGDHDSVTEPVVAGLAPVQAVEILMKAYRLH